MTEAQLQTQVIKMATKLGWWWWHDINSRRNRAGMLDLMLVHLGTGRLLLRELKSDTGKLRPEQAALITVLVRGENDVAVWRPADLESGRILEELSTP